jgi:hypothetical protein
MIAASLVRRPSPLVAPASAAQDANARARD